MKIVLMIIAMMTGIASFAQQNNAFNITKDKESGAMVYTGMINLNDLKNQLSFTWLDKGIAAYKPDTASVRFLEQNLGAYKVVIFLGTWCEDSQNLVPKLFKVLQLAHYPMNKYMMYGVDRNKRSLGDEQNLYNITNVPTFILYKNNHEVGRITEAVQKSVEKDLQNIITADLSRKH